MTKNIGFLLLMVLCFSCKNTIQQNDKPKVAFSFDDPLIKDMAHYKAEEWDRMILETLDSFDLQAILYVHSNGLNNEEGKKLLQKWNDKGHLIGNHTRNHLNYNDSSMTCSRYMKEILSCDSLIRNYSNYRKLFRFPLLKTGNTIAKRDSMRLFLKQIGYGHGWVTIDNSDWYINTRLIGCLRKNPDADISAYREYYVNHIFERATYYNNLSKKILNREIPHTLLLHHKLSSALFLGDLIKKFKREGWQLVDYSDAIEDPVYKKLPDAMPSDQSLIWLLAKQSGNYENALRYPPEDGMYEKDCMDSLGF